LPVFTFDKVVAIVERTKAFLNPERSAAPNVEQRKKQPEKRKNGRQRKVEQIKSKKRDVKRELSWLKKEHSAAKAKADRPDGQTSWQAKKVRKKKQELFRLKNERRTATKRKAQAEPQTGALPDFVIIGAGRCGTTFFYRLLTQHPHVQPAAFKELHFFNNVFDEGVEWYRQCFPAPKWMDGRKTVTGEATPSYISHALVPERMAKVIPQARLIALLRNPVDRTYSAYHHRARNRGEARAFEEAIETDLADGSLKYLLRGVYVDHLLRWSEYFPKEQMLVLKSEDLFECPATTLKLVEDFLELPDWQPEALEPRDGRNLDKYKRIKRNKGRYEEEMDPTTRRRLEEYFEPHNQRLYEFLGADFGW
jgi:hypothetical protein